MKYKKIYILCFFVMFYFSFFLQHSILFSPEYDNKDNNGNITNLPSTSATSIYEWNKTWGGSDDDSGRGIAVDDSENALVAGFTRNYGAGKNDVLLLKYNSIGNLLWYTTWGGSANDYGMGIAVDGSGNAFITGSTRSYGAGNYDVILLKYDSTGNLLWNRVWGGSSDDWGYDIAIDDSGNTLITGRTQSFGSGGRDVFLLKYDSDGNLLWYTTWGGSAGDMGTGIVVDDLGNAFIAGRTESFGAGSWDVFLLKFDTDGNKLWDKLWGGIFYENAYEIVLDDSGNAFISGFTESFGVGQEDVLLLKYDSAGNLLWNRTWGGSSDDRGYGIVLDDSGNLFITGITESFGAGGSDVILLKYDSAGNLLWNKTWGGPDGDNGVNIAVDDLGNILITGYTTSYGSGGYDVFLLKFGNYKLGWYIYTRNDKKGIENIEFYNDIETWKYLGEEEYYNGVKIYDTYNRGDWNEKFAIPIKISQKNNYYTEEGWYYIHL